jgi:hypothetical protein
VTDFFQHGWSMSRRIDRQVPSDGIAASAAEARQVFVGIRVINLGAHNDEVQA